MYVICFYFWSANSSDRGAFILASPSMSRVPSEDCKVVNRKARNKTFERLHRCCGAPYHHPLFRIHVRNLNSA